MIYYRKTLFGCGPKLTAVHAYYSANKDGIKKQVAERSVASNDAQLNDAIANVAA